VYADAIVDTAKCAAACAECTLYCLKQGGKHAEAHHIGMMQDCAEICSLAQCLMLRASPNARSVLQLCADVCQKCAQHCGMFNDATMNRCVEASFRAAQTCKRIASA